MSSDLDNRADGSPIRTAYAVAGREWVQPGSQVRR